MSSLQCCQNLQEEEKNHQRLLSDLQLVFEELHVGDSEVDLRQQSFDVLHCDAATARNRQKKGQSFSRYSASRAKEFPVACLCNS